MKKVITGLSLILLFCAAAFAQDGKYKKDPNSLETKEQRAGKTVAAPDKEGSEESMEGILLGSGTNLEAKLLSTLDVRRSDVGDQVVLEMTKSIKQDGEVVVPKGSKLIGRITEVKERSKQDKSSKISMVFESLQNKELSSPLNASIVSIARAGSNLTAGDLFSTDASGSSRSSVSSSGGGSGGGGLLGGATGAVGGVLNTATSTVGGVTNTVGSTAGGAAGSLGSTINGIQIMQSADASASGSTTLSAENKNIKLEKGTQFQLQLNESVRN